MKRYLKISGMVLAIALLGTAASVSPTANREFEITKNLEIYGKLYRELNTYYVDELDPGKLMRNGLEAMVGSLDPFTNYISEADIEGYRFASEGKYNGIGAQSKLINGKVTITELYQGQPADEAGLKVGDQILEVDGQNVSGKSPEELNFLLQGFPGTEVDLTINRPGQTEAFDLQLTRGEVNVPNVPHKDLLDEDIAYASLTTFTRQAGRNVGNALRDIRKENPELKGMILDLRGNGGGLLSEAVNVCNVFIPNEELVVTTKGKVREWDRAFRTNGPAIDQEIPVVVLINKNSASASEIVSGVIQDYDRGVLIGQRSYGKGLVQNTRDIGYNSKLKLTTAKYYIPSGRCIQSVEYEDGEPVDIPDDRRTVFKTRNGRPVLDGGGVTPDIRLDRNDDIPVLAALNSNDLIFDFVTEYMLDQPVPEDVFDIQFNAFDSFLAFLADKDLRYDTRSEKILRQLESTAKTEGYDLSGKVAELRAKIKAEQKELILANKELIIDQIEKEIAGRYFYRKGAVQMGLRNDPEVEEAIKVLKDADRYQAILSGK